MTARRGHLLALSAVLVALGTIGCRDPYADSAAGRSVAEDAPRRSVPSMPPDGELSGRVPERATRRLHAVHGRPARTTQAAVRAFAHASTNWTGPTVVRRFTALARQAVGQARQQAQQTAASAGTDPQLTGRRAASRGVVEAVVLRPDGWALVVCREETISGPGEPSTVRLRVYRAHTRPHAAGFVVDQWQPQP